MRSFVMVLALAAVAAAPAPEWRETAVTQAEMNRGASGDLKAAQAELDAVLQDVTRAMGGDSGLKARLAVSQEAWMAHVEAHVALLYGCDASEHGSARPACEALDRAALVKSRAAELRQMLLRPAEEDICWWRRPCENAARRESGGSTRH